MAACPPPTPCTTAKKSEFFLPLWWIRSRSFFSVFSFSFVTLYSHILTERSHFPSHSSDAVYECSDYHTAGENSCFFNKNDTSIWINYNITVVATNALGSSFSDPVDIDVVYIGEGKPLAVCSVRGEKVRGQIMCSLIGSPGF